LGEQHYAKRVTIGLGLANQRVTLKAYGMQAVEEKTTTSSSRISIFEIVGLSASWIKVSYG
jgi:hypothetical protein